MTERPASRRLERFKSVCERTGYSRTSVYRLLKDKNGGFPTPFRIGANAIAFDADEVDAWIAEKMANPGVGTSPIQRKRTND